MPESAPELRELGRFLKARRAELRPQQIGLPDRLTERRRVNALRREEVADLVAISTDYYTRIEQGRLAPSGPVLEALARAFGLDDGQSEYLRTLLAQAGSRRPVESEVELRRNSSAHPRLLRLLDQLDATPAMVLGRAAVASERRRADLGLGRIHPTRGTASGAGDTVGRTRVAVPARSGGTAEAAPQ
ncbi:XRE family transcriptional regulator [Mycolicibacterium brumae]|uniref:XRE family transcriptional regulator n=1 Tax=Mycolicibacterium brumae TaxID=85968 RepID=A0A2G5PGT6_9MYCO|nr:helix-turn-helix transcriptional regulator [Mycolicibacterium brumae]PIB77243.1 XRE family transcriptional regulator [Mycolicibacterium brumae]UWW10603.1 helix-turn-helix transcriptional regulator [Mycolicibacterium brumae]